MRAANCATTSATRVCPTAAITQSQIPTGPEACSTSSKVAKIPTATEMNANEIANTWNEPSVRFSSCRYPPSSTAPSPSCAPVATSATSATSPYLGACAYMVGGRTRPVSPLGHLDLVCHGQ